MRGIGIAIAGLLLAAPAQAQNGQPPRCMPAAQLMEMLKGQYGEDPIACGVAGTNLMVMLAGPRGTWTLIQINPVTGVSCIMGAGDRFQMAPQGQPT